MKRILTTLAQKWPEYLLEILVLIIGIYGAFALEKWREKQKEIASEQTLLKQLNEEYRANLEQLDSKIATRNFLIQSSRKLLEDFDRPKNAVYDSILMRLSNLGLTVTFDPIENDLIGSGNINLIQNQNLKKLLTKWSTDVIQVQEVERLYLKRYHEQTLPILIRLGVGRSVDELFWQTIQALDFTLENHEISRTEYGISKFSPKKEEILSHVELEGLISNSIMINEFINLESVTLRRQITYILKHLDGDIK